MKKFTLQNIAFPKSGICSEYKMYFRKTKNEKGIFYNELKKKITMAKFSSISFNTYFNSFSMEKWIKYTSAKYIYLEVVLQGSFIISLYTSKFVNNKVVTKKIKTYNFESESKKPFTLTLPSNITNSSLYFQVDSIEKNSIFYGGQYFVNESEYEFHKINLAIIICTYKRETYIKNTVDILLNNLLLNKQSNLFNNLSIYIVDNGQTLNINEFDSPYIHVIPNINTGGTGGFARGMIECIKTKEDKAISHILLMDDDIVIDSESINKTYAILTLLKDRYIDSFIGGSMISLEEQNLLIETGAIWNNGYIHSGKRGYNLNKYSFVLENEIEENVQYNAWWYCCFPISTITNDNLPLPLFIRGDDVEFGLRNTNTLILMNGICVWHEPFESKYSSWINYYMMRNQLIIDALHSNKNSKKKINYDMLYMDSNSQLSFYQFLFKRITRDIIYFKYNDALLTIKGVEDYFKGITFLKEADPIKLHNSITNSCSKMSSLEDLNIKISTKNLKKANTINDNGIKKLFRYLTLNGYLLPSSKVLLVSTINPRPINFYGAKAILLFDEQSKKGIVLKRSFWKMMNIYKKYIKISIIYFLKDKKVSSNYKKNSKSITSISFWNHYLHIEDK